MVKVIAGGFMGILHSIDYDKKTALVEMDYQYLVEYPWDKVVVYGGNMKKLKYYYQCAKWLWKNRSWKGTRQKYKAMERELKKYE